MAATTDFAESLGLDVPVIQAPMASASTVDLAVAVSVAGGLGSLAAGLFGPDAIRTSIRAIRARTDRPFAVNLFAMDLGPPDPVKLARAQALLAEIERLVGADRFELHPPPSLPDFADQFRAVIEERPAVFSFTFGMPSPEQIAAAREAGILVVGTATSVAEARALQAAGVSAVVCQGAEAGGHRGSFLGEGPEALVDTMSLVRLCREAVRVPVIASGGLMDGRDISAALDAGASAAQLGTAFLCCPETALLPAWRDAILAGRDTVLTRVLTGRTARAIRNRLVDLMEPHEPDLPAFPYIAVASSRLRAWAIAHGEADYLPLLSGQGTTRVRALPAADLLAALSHEMAASGSGRLRADGG